MVNAAMLASYPPSAAPTTSNPMSTLLPSLPLFAAFVAASIVLAVTPGPGVFYVVSRTVAQGRRAGLVSVAGVALGNLGNAIGASLGLAALFAVSAVAFGIVKFAGALYLVAMGIQMLRSARERVTVPASDRVGGRRVFRDGFVVALLNPKTTLFYAAFLPQFLTPPVSPVQQSMLLAFIFVAIAAATDAMYVFCAGVVMRFVGHRHEGLGAWGRRLGGGTFVGLGIYVALMRAGTDK